MRPFRAIVPLAALLSAGAQLVPAQAVTPASIGPVHPRTLANADFEIADERGAPVGWKLIDPDPADGFTLTRVLGEHGYAARLASTAARPGYGGVFGQVIEAAPWRGKLMEVTARAKIESPVRGGLSIVVRRPEPNATGFRDSGSSDLATSEWRTVHVIAHVDEDALTFQIGAALAGSGAILIDDIVIQEARLTTSPPSAEASAYLDTALKEMHEHYRAGELDWPAIEAEARREIAGAHTPQDTWWAIRSVLGTLGDHHSFLDTRNANRPAAVPATTAPPPPAVTPPMPTTGLLDRRFGLIALPELNTFGSQGEETGAAYVATARAGLLALDRSPLCGWIVDLRENEGGNMWPMLNGISPLLGSSPYGAFVTPAGERAQWVMSSRGVVVKGDDGSDSGPSYPPFDLAQAGLPLAVLTSDKTGSSGEAVTIAFSGRPGSRRFGTATAGYTTANHATRLSDGAVLAVASSWEQDRLGRDYRDKIMPDEATSADGALDMARRWLGSQCTSEERH